MTTWAAHKNPPPRATFLLMKLLDATTKTQWRFTLFGKRDYCGVPEGELVRFGLVYRLLVAATVPSFWHVDGDQPIIFIKYYAITS